jgi:hypothetical protein
MLSRKKLQTALASPIATVANVSTLKKWGPMGCVGYGSESEQSYP